MQVETQPASSTEDDKPDAATVAAAPFVIAVDAFGIAPSWRSRIVGLGGDVEATDPNTAFHTDYLVCNKGDASLTLSFTGLTATAGTLKITINALLQRRSAVAYPMAEIEVSLAELASSGRAITLPFVAEAGTAYALRGTIAGDTDAAAAAITILLQRGEAAGEHSDRLIAARKTVFGASFMRPKRGLIASGTATLREPVSQMCTAAQFDEPQYGEWMARMAIADARHRKQWEFAYILETLRHHGMLREGMRGLGFGVGMEPLPAVMAAMGCTIVGTDLPPDHQDAAGWSASSQHGASLENLRRPEICPNDVFDRNVSFRPVDMTALPADLVDFDFTWSSCAYEHLGSIPAGLKFVEDSVQCLKVGGIAVHTTELNLSSNRKTVDTGGTVLFRRRDLEALARSLIRRGHSVAAFNYDQGDTPLDIYVDVPPYREHDHLKVALSEHITTSFGIMVRRGAEKRPRSRWLGGGASA